MGETPVRERRERGAGSVKPSIGEKRPECFNCECGTGPAEGKKATTACQQYGYWLLMILW